jgi:hypothetical protein
LRGADLDVALMRLEREQRKLAALQARAMLAVEHAGAHLDDGYRGIGNWVSGVTNTSRANANRSLAVARVIEAYPVIGEAADDGDLGAAQLAMLADVHGNPRVREAMAAWQDTFVEWATRFSFYEFATLIRRWLLGADPDGAHKDHETSRENRNVKYSQVGAGYMLTAEGNALDGDTINDLITRRAEEEYQKDVAAREAMWGDQANDHPLPRTARQRRYDAFVSLILNGGGTPNVVIHTNQAAIDQALGVRFAEPAEPSDPSDQLPLCQTGSGAPVDLPDMIRALIHGQVQRLVTDSDGVVINLSRRHRLFTGSAREAILLANDRCDVPGCWMRYPSIPIDHIKEWVADQGATDQDNGRAKCGHHNDLKSRLHITARHDADGWHYFRADGTEIAPRPPRTRGKRSP